MARRGTPALYELLGRARDPKQIPTVPNKAPSYAPAKRTPASAGESKPSAAAPARASSAQQARDAASPRKSAPSGAGLDLKMLRIPAIAILALVALFGMYRVGVTRGSGAKVDGGAEGASITPSSDGSGQAGAASTRQASTRDAAMQAGSETSGAGSGIASGAGAAARAQSENQKAPAEIVRQDPAGSGTADQGNGLPPTPKGVDPRQAGLNYLVLASVPETNAEKVVAFCRERGLDAWVVPDHNGRLREITVLPGIPKSELNGTTATALKARVRKVGGSLKSAARGNPDFEGAYFKLYNG
jgi:hypothetical protein